MGGWGGKEGWQKGSGDRRPTEPVEVRWARENATAEGLGKAARRWRAWEAWRAANAGRERRGLGVGGDGEEDEGLERGVEREGIRGWVCGN